MSTEVSTEVVETKETITLDDKVFDVDSITPSVYFDYVKGLKEKINREEYNIIIDDTLKKLKACKATRQTARARELTHKIELALRELDAADKGFDIFVSRKVIEKFVVDVEGESC